MNFVVPVPSETFDVVLEDGASIRVRRHGNRDGVRLTVTHGNGFASDAYLPFWQQLTPHYDVLVFDFRNHGQNVPVEPSNHNYAQLSRDLDRVRDAIDSRLGKKATVGIFHSMSGRAAMKHAIEIGWRWDALMLFDPPDVPLKGHPLYAAMEVFENKLTEWAKGRRRRSDSDLTIPAASRERAIGAPRLPASSTRCSQMSLTSTSLWARRCNRATNAMRSRLPATLCSSTRWGQCRKS